jgi:hypothetical protein
MKNVIMTLVLAATLSGCANSTKYGECIGLWTDKDPALKYELSYWNVFVGILFGETVIVPIVVAGTNAMCPEGKK